MILFCDEERGGKKISKVDLKKKIAILLAQLVDGVKKTRIILNNSTFHNISLGKNILKLILHALFLLQMSGTFMKDELNKNI